MLLDIELHLTNHKYACCRGITDRFVGATLTAAFIHDCGGKAASTCSTKAEELRTEVPPKTTCTPKDVFS